MLIGEFTHSIDPKGRITIPSKFREELSEGFVITKGFDNCLFLYPLAEWDKIETKLKNLPMTNKNVRSFVRTFFSGAEDTNIDKQGRVLLPQNLREHALIEKEAVIIGVSTRVEIWSKSSWDDYNLNEGLSYEEMAEKMAELGI